VAPILVKNCQACHGPRDPKGNYQVTSFQLLAKPGESESAPIVAGKPDESEIWSLASSDDPDARMPKDADPLPAGDLAVIKQWLAEGAKFDGPDPAAPLAGYAPRPPHPAPPEVYPRPTPVAALAFRPDGQQLAVSGYHEVLIYSPADGKLVQRIKNLPERIHGLAWSPDGGKLAVAGGMPGDSGEVKLLKPDDGTVLAELAQLPDVALKLAFNPAGTKLAACGADRTIRLFDVASAKAERVIEDHADWVMAIAFSPDGSQLASASRDKTAKLLSAATGEPVTTYSGHGEPVFGVGFTADGKSVVSAGADRKVHVWNPADGAKKAEAAGFGRDVLALATWQDKVFTASADRSVQQHRGDGLGHFRTYTGLDDAAYAVAYHDSTKRVAAGSFSGQVIIWNAEDGGMVRRFVVAPGMATAK
jgi:WD40 repeat protein